MTNRPLYELTKDFLAIENMLDNSEYPIEDVQAMLVNWQDKIEDKVDNIGKLILSNRAVITTIDTEVKRLLARKQGLNNTEDFLKDYLLTEMSSVGITKVKRDILTVYIGTAQKTVEIDSISSIPEEYQRIIPEQREPDKVKIKKQFEDTGEIISGTRVIEGKKYIVVR